MKVDTKIKSKVQWRQPLILFEKHTLLEGMSRKRIDLVLLKDQWAIQGLAETIGCSGSPYVTKNKVWREIKIWKDFLKPTINSKLAIKAEPTNQTDTNHQKSSLTFGQRIITMKEWNVMKVKHRSRIRLRMEHQLKIGLLDYLRLMIAL